LGRLQDRKNVGKVLLEPYLDDANVAISVRFYLFLFFIIHNRNIINVDFALKKDGKRETF